VRAQQACIVTSGQPGDRGDQRAVVRARVGQRGIEALVVERLDAVLPVSDPLGDEQPAELTGS
jgi:hypothetical protein